MYKITLSMLITLKGQNWDGKGNAKAVPFNAKIPSRQRNILEFWFPSKYRYFWMKKNKKIPRFQRCCIIRTILPRKNVSCFLSFLFYSIVHYIDKTKRKKQEKWVVLCFCTTCAAFGLLRSRIYYISTPVHRGPC